MWAGANGACDSKGDRRLPAGHRAGARIQIGAVVVGDVITEWNSRATGRPEEGSMIIIIILIFIYIAP